MPSLSIDGQLIQVEEGTTVAAAVLNAGITSFRSSVHGEPRAPICGMGICYECRVTINDVPHQRSCMFLCAEGMEVVTG
ncbi:MAG: (2Fe-2S)-binding protein [Fimbriimonas sp.]